MKSPLQFFFKEIKMISKVADAYKEKNKITTVLRVWYGKNVYPI